MLNRFGCCNAKAGEEFRKLMIDILTEEEKEVISNLNNVYSITQYLSLLVLKELRKQNS